MEGQLGRDISLKDRLSWEQNTQTGLAFTRRTNTRDADGIRAELWLCFGKTWSGVLTSVRTSAAAKVAGENLK